MSNETSSTLNPYQLAIDLLDSNLYIQRSNNIQLNVLSGLFGLIFVLLLISLIARWKYGTLWFFRTINNKSGTWILPHATCCYSLFTAIAALVIQGFLQSTRDHSIKGSDLRNSLLWRTLSWTPYFIAAWTVAHATAISPILARSSNTSMHKLDPTRYPLIINSFFICVPTILISIIIAFSYFANKYTNQAWDLQLTIRSTLIQNGIQFDQGNITGLVDPRILLLEFASEDKLLLMEAMNWLQKVWFTWVVADGLLFILFVISGIAQLKYLKKAINRLRAQKSSKRATYSERMNTLENSYRSLCFTAIITLIIEGFFFAFGIILCVKTEDILFSKNAIGAVVELGCFWVFCSFGLISTLAILLRSFVLPPSYQNTVSSNSISLQNQSLRSPIGSNFNRNQNRNDSQDVTVSKISSWDEALSREVGGIGEDSKNSFSSFGGMGSGKGGIVRVDQSVEVRLDDDREDYYDDIELEGGEFIGRSPNAFDLEFKRKPIPVIKIDSGRVENGLDKRWI